MQNTIRTSPLATRSPNCALPIHSQDAENTINLELDYKPTYVTGSTGDMKAPLLDEWELATTEVIVERKLGEGVFGEVFKGVIKGPLRNPKISPLLKQSIGIPVAIKLLKSKSLLREQSL